MRVIDIWLEGVFPDFVENTFNREYAKLSPFGEYWDVAKVIWRQQKITYEPNTCVYCLFGAKKRFSRHFHVFRTSQHLQSLQVPNGCKNGISKLSGPKNPKKHLFALSPYFWTTYVLKNKKKMKIAKNARFGAGKPFLAIFRYISHFW